VSDDPECAPGLYEVEFPEVTYEGPLKDAPIPLKVFKVQSFLSALTGEVVASFRAGAELPAALVGLAAVDYMAGFYVGRETKKRDYVSFLRTMFPSRYAPHAEAIYRSLRCGLMHNLVAVDPWRGGRSFLLVANRPDHLGTADGRTVFSINQFFVDIWCAWRRLAYAVIMCGDTAPEIRASFDRRFRCLSGAGAFMEKHP
jgi:hypothetical protein